MLTSKPFSTISYNSENFLKSKLKELEDNHFIDEWYFIYHKGETDFFTQEKEKNHYHVYISPCKRMDTDSLREQFKELDPNNAIPLGVMPFRNSKRNDWIMYVIHDEWYLRSKGLTKEYTYSWKLIKACDDEMLKRAVKEASATAYKELRKRETVSEMGVVGAFNSGILKVNEVLGYIAVERQALESVHRKLATMEIYENFHSDNVGVNPFSEKGVDK